MIRDQLAAATGKFGTVLADQPWVFQNRTGKVAPEHKRLPARASGAEPF
jgi:hypothetical protein